MQCREPMSKTSTTMAEGNRKEESYSSWFGGFLAAAKEKSEKAFEMVCNDLDEFTCTMQKDTKKVVEQTKDTLKSDENSKTATDKIKTGFSYLMDGITKALTVEPEDTSPPKTKSPQPDDGIFDRAKARIHAIQVDTGTYLHEPSGSSELYADWLKSFDLESKKGEISELLISMVEVRSLYATSVPLQVSHQEFWQRYFYKIHQLEVDEARKQALMKRADSAQTKEDSISWDDEEWSADDDQPTPRNAEEIENRLNPDIDSVTNIQEKENQNVRLSVEDQSADSAKTSQVVSKEDEVHLEKTVLQDRDIEKTKSVVTETQSVSAITVIDSEGENKKEIQRVEKETTDSSTSDKDLKTKENEKEIETEKALHTEQELAEESKEKKVCDSEDKGVMESEEKELKTKIKGDMVVVGTERISPSSDVSTNKESSSEDWEQDFDIDLTEEDIKAAAEVAKKLNVSSSDYTKLTGDQEEDWENWE